MCNHIIFRDRQVPTLLDICVDDNAEWAQIVGGGYAHTAALTKEGKVFHVGS